MEEKERKMLIGEYHHSVDKKGRLIIPSSLRQQVGKKNDFIITRGLDKSLFLYSSLEWQNLGNQLKNLSTTQSNTRAFLRLFFSGAHAVQPDTQGRITLPQTLKDFAQIKEKVVIIGAFNKIEIWSKERWNIYYREKRAVFEELSEKIMDLGI
ncbi:MAG: division/cell wall cluster transcriptional repressor MraZ [Candidatus Aerophobetes bacterium]|nr:division/cell wall cluster transcriptional repressor MraZ [Candidatus Aerophobetes bacterium]